VLCADPKEGDSRIRHDSTATITPDFMGLAGTLTIRARPESRLTAVVSAIGLKLYGEFNESAASASNDMEPWTRLRPIGAGRYDRREIQLALVKQRGEEADDLAPVDAEVIAVAGTLRANDLVRHATRGTYEVRGVVTQDDWERATIRK
jgi:hypothetical protein